jgi:hypothetical protein
VSGRPNAAAAKCRPIGMTNELKVRLQRSFRWVVVGMRRYPLLKRVISNDYWGQIPGAHGGRAASLDDLRAFR